MYRVFESLDELVELVETARGLPMSGSCVVPRSAALDLLDDVRDAFPQELPDAQAVIDQRDEMLAEARERAEGMLAEANAERERVIAATRAETDRVVGEARAERDRLLAEGTSEHQRLIATGRAQHERLVATGRAEHHRLVETGQAEHERLITQTTVYAAAAHAAEQIHTDAVARAERMRVDTDGYVDERLAAFADLLTKTLRSIENSRAALRRSQPRDPETQWKDYGAELGSGESTKRSPVR